MTSGWQGTDGTGGAVRVAAGPAARRLVRPRGRSGPFDPYAEVESWMGPGDAVAPGGRVPFGETLSWQRPLSWSERLARVTGFDPAWGDPPPLAGFAWDRARRVYVPRAGTSSGSRAAREAAHHYAVLARSRRFLQPYRVSGDEGLAPWRPWRLRLVGVPAEGGSPARPYEVVSTDPSTFFYEPPQTGWVDPELEGQGPEAIERIQRERRERQARMFRYAAAPGTYTTPSGQRVTVYSPEQQRAMDVTPTPWSTWEEYVRDPTLGGRRAATLGVDWYRMQPPSGGWARDPVTGATAEGYDAQAAKAQRIQTLQERRGWGAYRKRGEAESAEEASRGAGAPGEAPPLDAVEVPSVVGRRKGQAGATLTHAGLLPRFLVRRSEPEEHGKVLAQDPMGGEWVPRGSHVTLEVGATEDAKGQWFVPEVVGKAVGRARSLLASRGMKVRVVREPVSGGPRRRAGYVFAQSPAGGTPAARGTVVVIRTAVRLTGARGLGVFGTMRLEGSPAGWSNPALPRRVPAARVSLVAVPRVTGGYYTESQRSGRKALEDARNAFARVGLVVGHVRFERLARGDPRAGGVVRQSPPPGAVVPRGSAVDLVIAVGADPAQGPVAPLAAGKGEAGPGRTATGAAEVGLPPARRVGPAAKGRERGESPSWESPTVAPPPKPDSRLVEVPDVTGMEGIAAARALRAVGLGVFAQGAARGGMPYANSTVTAQRPAAGALVRGGTVVGIHTSLMLYEDAGRAARGKKPKKLVKVPGVSCLKLEDAKKKVRAAWSAAPDRIGRRRMTSVWAPAPLDFDIPKGTVMWQSLLAGSIWPPRKTLKMTVSRGNPRKILPEALRGYARARLTGDRTRRFRKEVEEALGRPKFRDWVDLGVAERMEGSRGEESAVVIRKATWAFRLILPESLVDGGLPWAKWKTSRRNGEIHF
ncbi:MAG: PASTA domain-containing protein, partial [Planctomycetota bacterium]